MRAEGGKTKILFAIGRFSVGGAEKLLVRQMESLDRERFEPSLITIFKEQKDSCAGDVRINECFDFRSVTDVRALHRVYKYLRRERFDVVVTSLFSANLLVRIASILARIPMIVSYEHNIYPNKRTWQKVMDKLLSFWTDRIIVDSEAARIFTARQEHIPLKKFTTMFIPPLLERRDVREPTLVRKELHLPENATVIGVVSRLVEEKGHRYLIDAAAEIVPKFADVYVLIVGWGNLEEVLRTQIEQLGLAERVKLAGRMDIQDVLPVMDLYVEPAVSTDLPVALMEAMREGKPIVATDIGDIPVFIEDGKTGSIVPPADAHALARRLEEMLRGPELRARFGAAAKQKVEQYSLENYMRTFEGMIADLVLNKTS